MDQFTNTGTRVRQIAQFPLWDSLAGGELALIQRGGVGGVYASITVADLVGWGLASGGGPLRLAAGEAIRWNGTLDAPRTLTASVGGFRFSGPVSVSGNLDALGLSIVGQPVATSAWVTQSLDYLKAHSVQSFNERTGAVNLMVKDITRAGGLPQLNPVMCGVCIAPTPWDIRLWNDQIATTAWVQNLLCTQPWAWSPSLQGAPTTTTPPAGDYSKRIANTMWVTDALLDFKQEISLGNVNLAGYAPLDSPQFTGIPTAPTAAGGTDTTQLATTAFVTAAVVAATKRYVDSHPGVGGGLVGFNVYSASQTITIPAGATKAIVEMWGSSGGSGAAINSGFSGPTGAGGFLRKFLSGITAGNTLVFTLGAAGSGGIMTGFTPGPGTAAGSTTLASGTQSISPLTCPGSLGTAGADAIWTPPSAGGSPSGGDLNVHGQGGMVWERNIPQTGPTGGHTMYSYGADSHGETNGTGSSGNNGNPGGLQITWYS